MLKIQDIIMLHYQPTVYKQLQLHFFQRLHKTCCAHIVNILTLILEKYVCSFNFRLFKTQMQNKMQ